MSSKFLDQLPKLETKSWKSEQGTVSLVTFLVAAFLLGIAVLIGLILVSKVFLLDSEPPALLKELGMDFLFSSGEALGVGEVITLGVVFLIGMVVALVSIHIFNNQALQKVVQVYAWLCAAFSLIVYWRVANNVSSREILFETQYPKYLLSLVVVMAAVYVLPILYERYNVRMFSIPLFIGNFGHLMLMLWRNIFKGSGDLSRPSSLFAYKVHSIMVYGSEILKNPETADSYGIAKGPDLYFFIGDIVLFIFMMALAISLVRNAPLFAAIHRQLGKRFSSGS